MLDDFHLFEMSRTTHLCSCILPSTCTELFLSANYFDELHTIERIEEENENVQCKLFSRFKGGGGGGGEREKRNLKQG